MISYRLILPINSGFLWFLHTDGRFGTDYFMVLCLINRTLNTFSNSRTTSPHNDEGVSAINYFDKIATPIQLHHGTADQSVPLEWSDELDKDLKEAGKEVKLFTYQGDDHNLSKNLPVALRRSVEFFDQYLK